MALNKYMHPRNPYKTKKPNFKELAIKYPEFRAKVTQNLSGKVILDFKDPEALRALTVALLQDDFGLVVSLPIDRLIPTVPQRLNYILWLEDIFENSRELNGIDIGTGASCIYPLLGCRQNGWSFLASEVDEQNLMFAQKNIQQNNLQDKITVKKVSEETLLMDLVEDNVTYNFCMCNPPFYTDHLEAQGVTNTRSDSRPEPHSVSTASEVESISWGGEVKFVTKMIDESLVLKNKIRVYTSLLGKKMNLSLLKDELQRKKITRFSSTEFCQGRTMRWGLAWTFDDAIKFPKSAFKSIKNTKPPLCYTIPRENPTVSDYTVQGFTTYLKGAFDGLKIRYNILHSGKFYTAMNIQAKENTWSHQRRRRRQQHRAESENTAENSIEFEENSTKVAGLPQTQPNPNTVVVPDMTVSVKDKNTHTNEFEKLGADSNLTTNDFTLLTNVSTSSGNIGQQSEIIDPQRENVGTQSENIGTQNENIGTQSKVIGKSRSENITEGASVDTIDLDKGKSASVNKSEDSLENGIGEGREQTRFENKTETNAGLMCAGDATECSIMDVNSERNDKVDLTIGLSGADTESNLVSTSNANAETARKYSGIIGANLSVGSAVDSNEFKRKREDEEDSTTKSKRQRSDKTYDKENEENTRKEDGIKIDSEVEISKSTVGNNPGYEDLNVKTELRTVTECDTGEVTAKINTHSEEIIVDQNNKVENMNDKDMTETVVKTTAALQPEETISLKPEVVNNDISLMFDMQAKTGILSHRSGDENSTADQQTHLRKDVLEQFKKEKEKNLEISQANKDQSKKTKYHNFDEKEDCLLMLKMVLRKEEGIITLTMEHKQGNKEAMHQIMQYFKNKFQS